MFRAFIHRIHSAVSGAQIFGLLGALAVFGPQLQAAPVAIFGREELFTLSSANITALKSSGFNTVILFVVDVETNGDLNYNGDHLVVQNGVYMGDSAWGARLASLKQAPTTINRIEVCTGGAGAQSWANIKTLIAAQGTGSSCILYSNFLALKNAIGIAHSSAAAKSSGLPPTSLNCRSAILISQALPKRLMIPLELMSP